MQTTNIAFVSGLMAVLLLPALNSVARDTPEQIKAREALRQKMAEMNTNTPAATVPPTVAPAPPAAPTIAPVPPPQKHAPVVPIPPVAAPAPTPPAAPGSSQFAPVPEAVEDPNSVRLRQALRQELAVPETSTTVAAKPAKPGRTAAATAPSMAPPPTMEIPASPVSGAKAARLAELLQRYTADQITAQEYHKQRAAILAEP